MAKYKIFENGELLNTIEADEAFCKYYCEKHGFAYELQPEPEPIPDPEPTDSEILDALLGVSEDE